MNRRTFLVLGLGLLLGGGAVVRQALETSDRERLFGKVNKQRVRFGRHPVRTDLRMMMTATEHAKWMAEHQSLEHSQLALPPGARWAGEIIGVGGDLQSVVHAWLKSPEHRTIMLYPKARFGGAGAVFNQRWWLCVQLAY